MNREIIVYKGITYARYPDSKYVSYRRYFYAFSKGNGTQKRTTLHRQLWKDNFGEIPDGYDIHHRDGNYLNNTIDNLECVSKKDHALRHKKGCTEERKQLLENIRPLTKEWHSSDEGKKWHSTHGKNVYENLPEKTRVCELCGHEYVTKCTRENIRFCSRKCINRNAQINRTAKARKLRGL